MNLLSTLVVSGITGFIVAYLYDFLGKKYNIGPCKKPSSEPVEIRNARKLAETLMNDIRELIQKEEELFRDLIPVLPPCGSGSPHPIHFMIKMDSLLNIVRKTIVEEKNNCEEGSPDFDGTYVSNYITELNKELDKIKEKLEKLRAAIPKESFIVNKNYD